METNDAYAPASASQTATNNDLQPPHFAIRNTICVEHNSQPPGHRAPLRWLSGVSHDVCIVPAALSQCNNTATPLVRSTQIWASFRKLGFSFGISGDLRTVNTAPSPGNNPRQPVSLAINAVPTIFWVESAKIAFLPRATAATATTTATPTAWPADNHYGTNSWTLNADQPIQHH